MTRYHILPDTQSLPHLIADKWVVPGDNLYRLPENLDWNDVVMNTAAEETPA